MNVSELIAKSLAAHGTRTAFGMPGGDSLPLVAALQECGIRSILVRDEATAGFAADATAQISGAPGLCFGTLGPGLTNLISGVTGALLDRAPVVAVTSRFRSDRQATYTHMMFDQEALMKPVAKWHVRLTAGNAPGEIQRALAIAQAPRPGPVWLEVPVEVANADAPSGPLPRQARPGPSGLDEAFVARVAALERPIVLAGFGARGCRLDHLADALGCPVITTYKAKGAIPEERTWSAGAAGLSRVADMMHQELIEQADGILLIGWDPAELRDHWLPGFPQDRFVYVLDDHVPTDLPTRIDALRTGPLPAMVSQLASRLPTGMGWTLDEVAAHRARWQQIFAEDTFGPATAIRAINRAVSPDTIATFDVGAHRITGSHVWRCDAPDTLLQSNGFASMGYGLPAAMAAAALGRPGVSITGDAGLQMVLGELGAIAENELDVTIVVFCDEALSLIQLKQERLKHDNQGVTFKNPDWVRIAEAFGGVGVVTSDEAALETAVLDAQKRGGLNIVAVPIDPAPYRRQM